MDRDHEHPDHFNLKISSLIETMSYTITLNDALSDDFTIETVPNPGLTSLNCTEIYPAYTGLASHECTVGNLSLLAGSKLDIHTTANSKIKKAVVKLVGSGEEDPVAITGKDGDDLTAEIVIPAAGISGFSILLTNKTGVTSGAEIVYRIDILPDHPPGITVSKPERIQQLATLQNKTNIAFQATDDFGLYKLALCYRVTADNTVGNITRVDLDLGQDHPRKMTGQYTFDLSTVKPVLVLGASLEFWLEATDGNTVTGPGITESEHYTLNIVNEDEFKQDAMSRLDDVLSVMEQVETGEAKAHSEIGKIIKGK